jgi:hypothetical protein
MAKAATPNRIRPRIILGRQLLMIQIITNSSMRQTTMAIANIGILTWLAPSALIDPFIFSLV